MSVYSANMMEKDNNNSVNHTFISRTNRIKETQIETLFQCQVQSSAMSEYLASMIMGHSLFIVFRIIFIFIISVEQD